MWLKKLFIGRSEQEEVNIVGVVSPSGVSGCHIPPDTSWTMSFQLLAWRVEAGPIQTEPLTIEREVFKEEIATTQQSVRPYSVVRLRCSLDQTSEHPPRKATLLKVLGQVSDDEELNSAAMELQRPITRADANFGTLTFDRRLGSYECRTTWNGHPIDLSLEATTDEELEEALRVARALQASQVVWKERVDAFAVEKLLPLKNEAWLDDDEQEITPAEFLSKMALESITVYPEGDFDFWHKDGDMFLGHSIQVSGNLIDGLQSADIPG